tara:strand:- start:6297 stop:6596 length:300 start_codon:yes stop_codon:yes gene_type:complete
MKKIFPVSVKFFNKDLIYTETECAYKVKDNSIYWTSLFDDHEKGYEWWNKHSDTFQWKKLDDWSYHVPNREVKSTWSDKHIIIDMLKFVNPQVSQFDNE